ncbi:MAG TPA: choice-of-anchor Q domain-containing protein, partial [Acidimicrobiales bacterium]
FIGIDNSGTLTLSDSTLSGNGSPAGGGVVNRGDLDVTGSTLSKNGVDAPAEGGGAIDNQGGTVTVTGSTLSGNTASGGANGGGIYNRGGSVTVAGSTLTGNNTGSGSGGGIYNEGGTLTITTSTVAADSAVDGTGGGVDNDSGTVTVTDSTLSRNDADYSDGGGGIANNGTSTISDSTLFENSALLGGEGGGVLNTGTLSLTSDTLSHNGAANSGGGVYGPATVTGTILSMNTGGNCAAGVVDAGWNLSDDTTCGFTGGTDISGAPALLAPGRLADNGGPTKTVALEALSPAVGAITSGALCATPDQRGVNRPTPCDMGSVQLALPAQVITSADHATAKVGTFFSFLVTTTGLPLPSISIKGKLPKHVKLMKNGDGTATISGTPTTAGTFPVVLMSTYGNGAAKKVFTQAFTLTVDS